jgi:hypothetical protein
LSNRTGRLKYWLQAMHRDTPAPSPYGQAWHPVPPRSAPGHSCLCLRLTFLLFLLGRLRGRAGRAPTTSGSRRWRLQIEKSSSLSAPLRHDKAKSRLVSPPIDTKQPGSPGSCAPTPLRPPPRASSGLTSVVGNTNGDCRKRGD